MGGHRNPSHAGRLKLLVPALAALMVALVAGHSGLRSGSTLSVAPLTRVSGPSPFDDCAVRGSGANYLHAEVEPRVAVNPTTLGTERVNIVAVWQQDRWSHVGARGIVAGSSFDGGRTWERTPLPFSACGPNGLPYERATDPWVSFGPDGTAYAAALSVSLHGTEFFPNDNAVTVATSADGGRNWGHVRVLKSESGTSRSFNDKGTVTADPTKPGVAYAVWERLEWGSDRPTPGGVDFTGPAWLAKTADGGATWGEPTIIFAAGPNSEAVGNQIVVDPRTGVLYNVFNWTIGDSAAASDRRGYHVAIQHSTDGGESWLAPQIIAALQTVGVNDPKTGAKIRTGNRFPAPAIDSTTGTLYVVWQDSRFNGGQYDELAISWSTDGGAQWSLPVRVNAPTGRPAFSPSVEVTSTGLVGVSYYDFRNVDSDSSALPTDYWLATSTNGGIHFSGEVHIAGPFDMLTAPDADGYFVGDYQGLASIGSRFLPLFVQANSGDPTDPTDVFATTASRSR